MKKFISCFVLSLIFIQILSTPTLAQQTCTLPFGTSITPLTDITTNYTRTSQVSKYGNFSAPSGLYPSSTNLRPQNHTTTGISIATTISASTQPIGLATIGMSNTAMESNTWIDNYGTHPSLNPKLKLVNGALGSHAVQQWSDPSNDAWTNLDERVAAQGLNKNQVQILWIKLAAISPSNQESTPGNHIKFLADGITQVIKLFPQKGYTNIKLIYLSSRTRSYKEDSSLNPEPFAYESAFAVRDVINRQLSPQQYSIEQRLELGNWPWLSWGPYLYGNGPNPRSDGFIWTAQDLVTDCVHPSDPFGREKVADLLFNFFATDPTSIPWFLSPPNAQINLMPIYSPTDSNPPTYTFNINNPNSNQIIWNFSDGTFANTDTPSKSFSSLPSQISVSAFSSAGWNRKILNLNLSPSPTPPPTTNLDFDQNGIVNILDYNNLIALIGTTPNCNSLPPQDLDQNCQINSQDAQIFALLFPKQF